jgi:hypothetical protein
MRVITHLCELPDDAVTLVPDELLDGGVVQDDVRVLAHLAAAAAAAGAWTLQSK